MISVYVGIEPIVILWGAAIIQITIINRLRIILILMRIFFLVPYCIPININQGASIHVRELVYAWSNAGHDIDILAPLVKNGRKIIFTEKVMFFKRNLNFFVNSNIILYYMSLTINGLICLAQSISIIVKRHPDIIYTRAGARQTDWPVVFISKLFGIPYFVELNGIVEKELNFKKFELPIYLLILGKTFKNACGIIAVTPGIIDHYSKIFPWVHEKSHVVSNGVDSRLFKPMSAEACRKMLNINDGPIVIFVGELAYWQGVKYLIEAVPHVLIKFPSAKFLLVGEGIVKKDLVEQVRKLGLAKSIIFEGGKQYEETPIYINAADICVAPFSKWRNSKIGLSPLKIYSYIACGKPIVASRVPNLEFIESGEMGILVEPEDPVSLAGAILSLLMNEETRKKNRENALAFIERNDMTWTATARKIADLFIKVVK
jgi:glycosyltransferase involved in cell wall biosynthesis